MSLVSCVARAVGLPVIQAWFGAKNRKFGAAGSLYDILTDEASQSSCRGRSGNFGR